VIVKPFTYGLQRLKVLLVILGKLCSREEWDGSSRIYCCVELMSIVFLNIVNECALYLFAFFKM